MLTASNRAAIAARMDNARLSFGKVQVSFIDNWRRAHHFGVVQIASIWGAICVLLPLLADHWPELAPVVVHLFPKLTPDWVGAIEALLTIAARLVIIRRAPPCQ